MAVNWSHDVDQSLSQAKQNNRPLLLDFSAAPAWGGCARLDAESYQDTHTADFIHQNFIPVKAHIKEHPAWFHRFDAIWTPTAMLLDPDGKERVRIEGYLTNREFLAALRNGLGRLAFLRKDYPEAERWYGDVAQDFTGTLAAPEAIYWRGVSEYRRSNDHTALGRAAQKLRESYPESVWALKSIPWRPKDQEEAAD